MEATYTCTRHGCGVVITRGGRDKQDAKESTAFAAADHLQEAHGETVTPESLLGKINIKLD